MQQRWCGATPPFQGLYAHGTPERFTRSGCVRLIPGGGSLLTHLSLREGSDSDLIIGSAAKRKCSVFQYGRGGGNPSIVPATWGETGIFFYGEDRGRSAWIGEKRISAVERKRRTRRLILMGSYMEHITTNDEVVKDRLMKGLDGFLDRDRDRDLFDLWPQSRIPALKHPLTAPDASRGC